MRKDISVKLENKKEGEELEQFCRENNILLSETNFGYNETWCYFTLYHGEFVANHREYIGTLVSMEEFKKLQLESLGKNINTTIPFKAYDAVRLKHNPDSFFIITPETLTNAKNGYLGGFKIEDLELVPNFPKEGCCYTINDDLTKYILNRPLQRETQSDVRRKDSVGIGWNETSCWWLKTKNSNKQEYQIDYLLNIIGKPLHKETNNLPKYEVGKWYEFDNPDYNPSKVYAKFLKLSDCSEYFYFEEYIANNKLEQFKGNWYVNKCVGLAKLSEIEHLLPDNQKEYEDIDCYYKVLNCGQNYSGFCTNDTCEGFGHSDLKNGDIFQGLKKGEHYSSKETLIYGKYQEKEQCFNLGALELSTKEEYKKQFVKEPTVYKDDKGRILKTFEVGKWYSSPKRTSDKYYCKVKSVEVVQSYNEKYYYNLITFDAFADKNWNITEKTFTQSNADYDVEMELVEPPVKTNSSLILDKFNIGDIVVSLKKVNDFRKEGDLFKILPKSNRSNLYYSNTNSSDKDSWRLATSEEKKAYHAGITNISQINKKTNPPINQELVGRKVRRISDEHYSNFKIVKVGEYDIVVEITNYNVILKTFGTCNIKKFYETFELIPEEDSVNIPSIDSSTINSLTPILEKTIKPKENNNSINVELINIKKLKTFKND